MEYNPCCHTETAQTAAGAVWRGSMGEALPHLGQFRVRSEAYDTMAGFLRFLSRVPFSGSSLSKRLHKPCCVTTANLNTQPATSHSYSEFRFRRLVGRPVRLTPLASETPLRCRPLNKRQTHRVPASGNKRLRKARSFFAGAATIAGLPAAFRTASHRSAPMIE